jgi:hypothetical protein
VGDVATHAAISPHVTAQLKLVFGSSVADEDYTYIELGNFLTDVKQFRDPSAFHRAREQARARAAEAAGAAAGGLPIDAWAIAMFGRRDPPEERHGSVPQFLARLAQALTHQVFDPDGLTKQAQQELPPGAGPSLLPAHPIPAAEVDAVIAAQFDQYWPHDHMDFPPVVSLATHRDHPLFRRRSSGMIGFVERYMEYLAEELTKLETEWAGTRTVLANTLQRYFVRLGVLLHAVEDFYFHSNVAELRQLLALRHHYVSVDPATPEGRAELFGNGLWGVTGLDITSVQKWTRLRRVLYRRLRYPVFDQADRLSLGASDDATDLLYTGGFYATDVLHTLGGALEAVERNVAHFPQKRQPGLSPLVLLRLAFNEKARRDLVAGGDSAAAALRTLHAGQLENGEYTAAINRAETRGDVSKRAAELLRDAFQYDTDRAKAYTGLPGPGAILIGLIADIQRERDASEAAASALDAEQSASVTRDWSSDGASGEDIGTHSLLSKDSPEKEPFREDALALAKHASAGVATVLARRLQVRYPPNVGIDWLDVLRFFMRFPRYPSLRWEEELIAGVRAAGSGKFKQPAVSALRDQALVTLLGPPRRLEDLIARRAGKLRTELENEYRSFESNP